ncbi:MAG: metal-dependent hydrolase [Cyclobacteriaceae bacterium]|nr:metal-dependent hydrolase [Cyclobacteriaceae bacterium]
MDSITHIVLGACIGEAVAGKELGKRAMLLGAIAQSIPDIDFLLSIWLRPVDNLLAHRGFTHSIFFGLIICTLAGWIASRYSKGNGITFSRWVFFFSLEFGIHLLLDGCNNYGVGWFEPFSHQRIAFNILYVADPFFSVWLGIGFAGLLLLRSDSANRIKCVWFALIISSAYLLYSFYNKISIESDVRSSLSRQQVTPGRILTTPTPLNNWLWFIAAEVPTGYYIGYQSVFDQNDSIDLVFFPKQESLLNELKDKEDLNKLIRFSQGYYTVEKRGDGLLFNDLRFGQIAGWSDPHAMFAFHYDLYHPDANLFVVQQGRFSNWNRGTVEILIKRISGDRSASKP